MSRKCITGLLMLLCIGLSACSKHDNISSLDAFTGVERFSYEVLTERFTVYTGQNHIEIQYPSFVHGTKSCTELNQLVKSALGDYLSTYGNNISNLTLSANYEITYANDELVSIVFRGTSDLKNAAHPIRFAFALNILVTYPRIAETTRIVSINDALAQEVIAHSKNLNIGVIDEYFEQFTVNDIKSMLQQEDVSFYLTSKGVGVILPVPHPIGDYVELLIEGYSTDVQGLGDGSPSRQIN